MEVQAARHWRVERDADDIAWLTLDRVDSTANALGREVLEELDETIRDLTRTTPRAVVILSGKPSGFIAGADIGEFTRIETPEQAWPLVRRGQAILAALERLPCPTVAAIDGFALGGGLELALACHQRVATPRSTFGLPEILLGIHPGFGGTVRAPRLVGCRAALDLILTGRTLSSPQALRMGLIDAVVPAPDLRQAARTLASGGGPRRAVPFLDRLLALPGVRGVVAAAMRRRVAGRARPDHYPAPYAAIDVWRRTGARGEAAYVAEAESISRLFCTATSRNLVHVYFLQERLKGVGRAGPSFSRVHVVGAGVMGGDIAAWCAYRGMHVTLQDRSLGQIEPALARAREFFSRKCHGTEETSRCLERLSPDPSGDGLRAADAVIEAIVEDPEAKRGVFERAEAHMRDDAILCTNTSSIPIEDLARGLRRPERLVGLHFFNPVSRMPLVEIVRGTTTGDVAASAAASLARSLGKLPLPCRSAPGFVVNRILMAYMSEALRAAQEGVPYSAIDRTAVDFGMPQGPIELADTVGLDVALHVGRMLAQAFGRPTPTALEPMVAAGTLGRKSGRGFYAWRDGRPTKPAARRAASPPDLQDRLVLQFVNEAVACLRDTVVEDEDLLDAGAVFGTGFAPFRGGPLHYARQRGVDNCVARLHELADRHGAHFRPDPGWQLLAARNPSART